MTNVIKTLFVLLSTYIILACSSLDKQDYAVTTMQSVGHSVFELADQKRQLGQYQEALMYYLESEKYALKRNDKFSFGLSQLKRGAIYLKLGEADKTLGIIDAVSEIERFESVGLGNALLFVKAQYQQHLGNTDTAVAYLRQLQENYRTEPEKHIYYQFVSWVYQPDSVDLAKIATGYNTLLALKEQGQLYNIEIFSYAVVHYSAFLVEQNNDLAESILFAAIDHFSMLEQSNKIAQCYEMLSVYFVKQEQPDKAEYYQQQAIKIGSLKVME